eukprot:4034388-Alexandrium_andersonii.AAC.1
MAVRRAKPVAALRNALGRLKRRSFFFSISTTKSRKLFVSAARSRHSGWSLEPNMLGSRCCTRVCARPALASAL